MDAERAMAIARRLHAGQLDESGAPVLRHIARVARCVPVDARTVAWLHEALETGLVSEHQLLAEGLRDDQLRALRLLARMTDTRSDWVYLAHVELIGRAAGPSGDIARKVKLADLEDRCRHPRVRADGWAPPYARAIAQLLEPNDAGRALTDSRIRSASY